MLHYLEARQKVIAAVSAGRSQPVVETVPLEASLGRVLAEEIRADRDYPPFHRSTRDGFAVRAGDIVQVPVRLKCLGEIRAGERFSGVVRSGECLQIMTGAPLPEGADAVVMVEHTEGQGEKVVIQRTLASGANVVGQGSEAMRGQKLLDQGTRIGYAEVALLGQVGCARVAVYRRPRVAVLSTGDEVVGLETQPGPSQIRNSSSYALAAQVLLSGGEPVRLGNARDELRELERGVERGLEEDLLVLTGGVSMGKYDLVEVVLRQLGATFHFDAVAIRPGRPAVFAFCRNKFVFGLPGNPVSTMVTFELFVAPAVALLGGVGSAPPLAFFKARLAEPVTQKTELTLFLPAWLERQNSDVTVRPLRWQGSGDLVGLAQGNCFLVVPESVHELPVGSWVDVLLRH
jgi:molybdopterin molybdotransferase